MTRLTPVEEDQQSEIDSSPETTAAEEVHAAAYSQNDSPTKEMIRCQRWWIHLKDLKALACGSDHEICWI